MSEGPTPALLPRRPRPVAVLLPLSLSILLLLQSLLLLCHPVVVIVAVVTLSPHHLLVVVGLSPVLVSVPVLLLLSLLLLCRPVVVMVVSLSPPPRPSSRERESMPSTSSLMGLERRILVEHRPGPTTSNHGAIKAFSLAPFSTLPSGRAVGMWWWRSTIS